MAKVELTKQEVEELDALPIPMINDRIAQIAKDQMAVEEAQEVDPHLNSLLVEKSGLNEEIKDAKKPYKEASAANKLRVQQLRSRLKNSGLPDGDYLLRSRPQGQRKDEDEKDQAE